MASKSLFSSAQPSLPQGVKPTDATNEAGGNAYAFGPEHALAQYALTGTLNGTFYASDTEQLKKVLEFAQKCDPSFVAKTAAYAREKGYMKDMPSLLLSYLATKDPALLKKTFTRVVDSPKMVRNFVQMIRSGQLGRKSLGTAPKKLVSDYLNGLSDDRLFNADVGNSPSLQDLIKMVRPRPANKQRAALYGYLIDKEQGRFGDEQFAVVENLTVLVREYEEFKKALLAAKTDEEKNRLVPPNVNFLMLTALPLTRHHWKMIAERASWTQLRMNLNSFAKHGVFEDEELVKRLAAKLADREQIVRARAFPYQLFAAYMHLGPETPQRLRTAIVDAADLAIENVPTIDGDVVVCADISGSMNSPATGHRVGATTAVTCRHVAALVAAAVLRKNPNARILPFSDDVVLPEKHGVTFNPRDSVITNAEKFARLPSGGTNCSAPLRYLNEKKIKADLVWFVSDNESWVDRGAYSYYGGNQATGTMAEFAKLKARCPQAKMVLLDIQPYATTQAHDRSDILNVGSFSDTVFEVVAAFARGETGSHLVDMIKKVEL